MTREKISQAERRRLETAFPGLPAMYFDHLQSIGWGDTANGRMLYSAPIPATEIYQDRSGLDGILLVGDDMQGYCVGYDRRSGRPVEVSARGGVTPIEDGYLADY